MSARKLLSLGMVLLSVTGCGQTVTETMHSSQAVAPYKTAFPEKIVILPFADYSEGLQSGAFQRNLTIMEAVTDQLVTRGFKTPVHEDVLKYLVDQDIIKIVSYGPTSTPTTTKHLEKELNAGWSDMMKEEISGLIDREKKRSTARTDDAQNPWNSPGTHGLDQKTIAKIGQTFQARYVVRGRVLEYDIRQEPTWEPFKKGILPVFFGATNRLAFGIAKSDAYDMMGNMGLGGAIGAIAGHGASGPFSAPQAMTKTTTSGDPLFPTVTSSTDMVGGTSEYAALNSLVWGAAGAGAGYLASQGGSVPQAVVHLRVWVQDTASGDVVWTNRAEVKVSPESSFADSEERSLFATAVDKSVAALIDDFMVSANL